MVAMPRPSGDLFLACRRRIRDGGEHRPFVAKSRPCPPRSPGDRHHAHPHPSYHPCLVGQRLRVQRDGTRPGPGPRQRRQIAILETRHVAAHRHPRPGAGTRRRGVVHRAGQRAPGLVRAEDRPHRTGRIGQRFGTARRDPGAGQGGLDHRRRAERHCPSGVARPRSAVVSPAQGFALCKSEHLRLRWRWRSMVHRPGGFCRQAGREDRRGHGQAFAARSRAVRDLRYALGRGLVVFLGRVLHRPHRPQDR